MTIDRRSFIKAAGAAAAAAPALGWSSTGGPGGGRTITARAPGKLRLLFITDTHYGASPGKPDERTTDHIRRLLDQWQPDALVHTGDMWTETEDQDCMRYAEIAADQMGKFGVPWAFARGNHDVALPSDDQRCREMLAAAPHSLYDGVNSQDCYRVAAVNPDGKPFFNLYLLNNSYRKLLGFHREQLDWFAAEAAKVKEIHGDLPAFAFFHIPLPAWQAIIDNRTARGVKFEKICLEGGSAGAFEALTAPGQIKAMFCGHDHTNNYHGMLDGVYIEYVRSTGEGTYGGEITHKGGTLAEIDANGGFRFTTETVMPDGRKFIYKRRVLKHQFDK